MAEAVRTLRTQHAILNYAAVFTRTTRNCVVVQWQNDGLKMWNMQCIMCVQHTPW